MEEGKAKQMIINTLKEKCAIKQQVYDNTIDTFNLLKEVLQELVKEYNKNLKKVDTRVWLEYSDKGAFEAELKVAGDLLVFNMHTNIFDFYRDHGIWKTSYVRENDFSTYTGIISIFNFLTDSFKYNRLDDLGYLIGRIFINKDNHYFVEGKRQLGFLYNKFGNDKISKDNISRIVESAILYALDFDLLVPPYDAVKITSVAQMKERINKSKMKTGKRLGFRFYADDDELTDDKEML